MMGLLLGAVAMPAGRDIAVPAFHRVELATKATMRIERAASWHVVIDGDPRVTRCVTAEVADGTLVVGWGGRRRADASRSGASDDAIVVNGRTACRRPSRLETLSIHVSAPAIDGVAISDRGMVSVAPMNASTFSASIPGRGGIALDGLKAGATRLSIAGGGRIVASGDLGALDMTIAGSGAIDTRAARARSISLAIGGYGDVAANVDGPASGRLMGSGTVAIAGNPVCRIRKLGKGSVLCPAGSR